MKPFLNSPIPPPRYSTSAHFFRLTGPFPVWKRKSSHWRFQYLVPGRTAGQTGHLAIQVTLVVRGNSWLGWDKMGKADRKVRRDVSEETEEGKESLGAWGKGLWDSLVSSQLCHTISAFLSRKMPWTGEGKGWPGWHIGIGSPGLAVPWDAPFTAHWLLPTGAWKEEGIHMAVFKRLDC